MSIKCKFGFHDWKLTGQRGQVKCSRCGKEADFWKDLFGEK